MRKILLFTFSLCFLSGCLQSGGPAPIGDVVSQCDSKDFYIFNKCIQLNYSGTQNIKISSFFAQLDVIEEDLNRKNISNAKAKVLAFQAYNDMLGSRNAPTYSGGTLRSSKGADALAAWANDYAKKEQERIDEFNNNQRNKRTTTTCRTFGRALKCTTR